MVNQERYMTEIRRRYFHHCPIFSLYVCPFLSLLHCITLYVVSPTILPKLEVARS